LKTGRWAEKANYRCLVTFDRGKVGPVADLKAEIMIPTNPALSQMKHEIGKGTLNGHLFVVNNSPAGNRMA